MYNKENSDVTGLIVVNVSLVEWGRGKGRVGGSVGRGGDGLQLKGDENWVNEYDYRSNHGY